MLERLFDADVENRKTMQGSSDQKFFYRAIFANLQKLLIRPQCEINMAILTSGLRQSKYPPTLHIIFSMFERISEPIYTMSRMTCTNQLKPFI